jgi:hypothetical protein
MIGGTQMNTAGFAVAAIISTVIMFGTVIAAHANAISYVSARWVF